MVRADNLTLNDFLSTVKDTTVNGHALACEVTDSHYHVNVHPAEILVKAAEPMGVRYADLNEAERNCVRRDRLLYEVVPGTISKGLGKGLRIRPSEYARNANYAVQDPNFMFFLLQRREA